MADHPGLGCQLSAAMACGLFAAGAPSAPPLDAVYFNGNIYTVDAARPRAAALGIRGDRLIVVGSNAEVLALAGPGTRRELRP